MKKIMILLIVLMWVTSAWAGLIFDNGTGNPDDTLQMNFIGYDSDTKTIVNSDMVDTIFYYVYYMDTVIYSDTITNPASYATFTGSRFFRVRVRASNSAGNVGQYNWDGYISVGGYHTATGGSYYVNDAGLGDFLTTTDDDNYANVADTTGLARKTDVTGLNDPTEAEIYSHFISGSNEDQFKATGFSTHNPAGVYTEFTDGSNEDVFKATGFSTFDPSTTPVVARDTTSEGETLAVKEDSLIYQGSGGGSDTTSIKAMMIGNQFARVDEDTTIDINSDGTISATASIPDSLFDTLTVIHEDIEALSLSGGGTEPETLIVLDAADSTLIQSAKITIRTLDQSTTKAAGLLTDVSGKRIFALDADSFWVEITHNNYLQIMDTLVIASGGGTDSLYMTQFDPGNPSDPDLCRVYGWVYDISGEDIYGVDIAAEIPRLYHPVKYSDLIITPFCKSTATDSSGYWNIDLIPSSKLSGDNIKYQFIIKYNSGVIFRTETDVPDSASWQLK